MPQEVVIIGDDGTEHVFPEGFDPKRAASIVSGKAVSAPAASQGTPDPSQEKGLGLLAATQGPQVAGRLAMNLATNPNVPKAASSMGRFVGAVAPPLVGAYEGGPMGAAVGLAGSAKGSWLGGRTGWHTGKLAQKVAGPVAEGLDAVAPYAKALTPLSIGQGVSDLAQMADPKRTDARLFGTGDPGDPNHPALLNMIGSKAADAASAAPDELRQLLKKILSGGPAPASTPHSIEARMGPAHPGTAITTQAPFLRGEMPVGGTMKTLGEMLPEFTAVGGEAALNAGRTAAPSAARDSEAVITELLKRLGGTGKP